MLATRDVILSSGTIHSIWKLGIHDEAMTPESIAAANVAEIAFEILQRQDQFVFKITTILLRGITTLYFKKTNVVLLNCQAVIERISLKFQMETPPKGESQFSIPDRTIEIDDETIRLWQAEDNLESIVADERREGPKLQLDRSIIHPSQRFPQLVLQGQSHEAIDDDFGMIPFQLPADDELNGEQLFEEDPLPPPPDDFGVVGPTQLSVWDKVQGPLKIDESPLIPITELSALLDDGSISSHRTHSITTLLRADSFQKPPEEIMILFEQAKVLGCRKPEIELQSSVEDEILQDLSPPVPPDDEFEQLNHENDFQAEERDEAPEQEADVTFDLFPMIAGDLENDQPVRFVDVVAQSKRQTARLFFSALCLHNRGIIRLTQRSWQDDIMIVRGPASHH